MWLASLVFEVSQAVSKAAQIQVAVLPELCASIMAEAAHDCHRNSISFLGRTSALDVVTRKSVLRYQ